MSVMNLPALPAVEIPPGDPEALREAARTYEGSGEQARQIGGRVRHTVHGIVGSQWSGVASTAFQGEGERIAGGHDRTTVLLHEATGALYRYAHQLEEAQRLARRAQQAIDDCQRQATQLRTQHEAAAGDPAAQAQMDTAAEQVAADGRNATAAAESAHLQARHAAQTAAGAFGAVAQGAIGLLVPGAGNVLTPKTAADGLLGFRKEWKVFRGVEGARRFIGSTDEALARYLRFGSKLERFAPALRFAGKLAPAVGGAFGVYQLVRPSSSAGERITGLVTATASGVLTASAFGAFATGALAVAPPLAAAALAGVALYQVGKLAYKYRHEIAAGLNTAWQATASGFSKAWGATTSGISKAARWTGDQLGNAKDWAADRATDAVRTVKEGVGKAAEAASGAVHTVAKGAGAVADAFGF